MLQRARVVLGLTGVKVPLGPLPRREEKAPSADADDGARRVSVAVAPVERPEVEKLHRVALREIIALAHEGTATLQFPLLARSWGLGPLSVETVPGQQLVVRLVVKDGRIARESCRGSVEPQLSLPLGISFNGVVLARDGALMADISRFPNFNLSDTFLRGFRVPDTLDALLDIIFAPRAPGADDARKDRSPPPVDISGLRVSARGVMPHGRTFKLGPTTHVTLDRATRLDITYGSGLLDISGPLTVSDGAVGGSGFRVEGLTGNARGAFHMSFRDNEDTLRLHAEAVEARVARAVLEPSSGAHLELVDASIHGATLDMERSGGVITTSVDIPRLAATLKDGTVRVSVDGNSVEVKLGPVRVEGSLRLRGGRVSCALKILDGKAVAEKFRMDLGLLDLDVERVAADLQGMLVLGEDGAFRVDGALKVRADVKGGEIGRGRVHAALDQGTSLALEVDAVEAHAGRWKLRGSGELHARLAGGKVRLWEGTDLVFDRGASGVVRLERVALGNGGAWPELKGSLEVRARAAPTQLAQHLEMPAGAASIRVAGVDLDEQGTLQVAQVDVEIDAHNAS